MSKPSVPGELRGVDVQFVSLVSKAANGKKFQIFKSADYEMPGDTGPTEKGLFEVLKAFFSRSPVEKGEMADKFAAKKRREDFWQAMDAFAEVVGMRRYQEDAEKSPVDAGTVQSALLDFTGIMSGILGAGLTVEKAGRKISGSRLATLKDAHKLLASIIEDAEGEAKESKEGSEVTKEEMQGIVKTALDEAVQPLAQRLEVLEKGEKPEEETLSADAVKGIVTEALKGIDERLSVVEKARGVSKAAPKDDTEVSKGEGESFWGGVFLG